MQVRENEVLLRSRCLTSSAAAQIHAGAAEIQQAQTTGQCLHLEDLRYYKNHANYEKENLTKYQWKV